MSSKLFRNIRRFNAIALAMLSLAALLLVVAAALQIGREIFRKPALISDAARTDRTGGGTSGSEELGVLTFQPIRGTTLLYAPVAARQDYDASYSSKSASSTRNYAFYDRATGASRMLFETNGQVILNLRELRRDRQNDDAGPNALLVEYISADANGDGALDSRDKKILALAKLDGAGLKSVSESIDRSHGAFVDEGGTEIVVMIDEGPGVDAVHIDLATFSETKRAQIAR